MAKLHSQMSAVSVHLGRGDYRGSVTGRLGDCGGECQRRLIAWGRTITWVVLALAAASGGSLALLVFDLPTGIS